MRNSIRKLLLATLSFSLLASVGCGGKDAAEPASADKQEEKAAPAKPAAPEKPVELTQALDIGAAVKDADDTRYAGIKMTGPAGSKVVDTGMGLTVEWGEISFEFAFADDGAAKLAKEKKRATEDTLDTLVKFHVDTPEAILWESKSKLGGDNNFSFVAIAKVGDKQIVCANKGYGQFSKVQAEALMKTCQSAKR